MSVYVSPSPQARIIEGEILSGIIDGHNKTFTTSDKFSMEFAGPQIKVYINGVRQKFTDDYSVSESVPGGGFDTIVFVLAPRPGDKLMCDYEVSSF